MKKCRFLLLPLYSLLLVLLISFPVDADVAVRPASEISNDTTDWMKKVADWQLTQSSWDDSVDQYEKLYDKAQERRLTWV